MDDVPECMGWWGKKLGHHYDHIFDVTKGQPTLAEVKNTRRGSSISGIDTSPSVIEILEASKPVTKKYVYSICRRCGHRIYRHIPQPI